MTDRATLTADEPPAPPRADGEQPVQGPESWRDPPSSEELSRTTFAGLRWSYLAAICNAVVQIGYLAAMARLLSPRDFGIVAMAQIAVSFGHYFTRMGVSQTIINREQVSERDLRVAATSSTLLGLLCGSAVALAAPAIAALYGTPDVAPVLRVLALTFLFLGMGITSAGVLRRQLRFREFALIEIAATVVGAATGLGMALAGAGVWSLVGATVVNTALTTALQYGRARHPARPLLTRRHLASLYSTGSRFSVLRIIEFLGRNLDTVAVGRYTTAAITGVYSRAYTLVSMPLTRYVSLALAKVLFPSFSAVQHQPARLRRALASILLTAALVLLPLAAGMAVAAPQLVAVMLGGQFEEGAVLVPFFAVAGALFLLSHIAQMACEAAADLNHTIGVQVASLAVLVGLLWLAAAGDRPWLFAAALTASEAVRHGAYLLFLRRAVGLELGAVRRAYAPALGAAVVVAAAVGLTRGLLDQLDVAALLTLLAEMAVAGLALLFSFRALLGRDVRADLWRQIRTTGLGDRAAAVKGATFVLGPSPVGHR